MRRGVTPRVGRPPKLVNGKPATTLPTFTTFIRPDTKAKLRALAEEEGTPAYELIESALKLLFASKSRGTQGRLRDAVLRSANAARRQKKG